MRKPWIFQQLLIPYANTIGIPTSSYSLCENHGYSNKFLFLMRTPWVFQQVLKPWVFQQVLIPYAKIKRPDQAASLFVDIFHGIH